MEKRDDLADSTDDYYLPFQVIVIHIALGRFHSFLSVVLFAMLDLEEALLRLSQCSLLSYALASLLSLSTISPISANPQVNNNMSPS